ncbi:MAG: UbiX family flavin prenyltransferase [Pseudomonadota bacterium]
MKRLIVGLSGASGLIYGVRLLEVLQREPDVETHLVISSGAGLNISLETDHDQAGVKALADHVYSPRDLAARISSGSFRTDGMVVAPCSMKTLSAIVNAYADNLLVRAADVTLKEQRRLVLMPRESPLHAGHCELLLRAARLGAVIAPPMPAMYIRPRSIEDLIDHAVGRVLDLFDIDPGIVQRWDGPQQDD